MDKVGMALSCSSRNTKSRRRRGEKDSNLS